MSIRPSERPLIASLLLLALTACTADQTEHAGVTIQRSDCVECHSGDVRAALFDHASVDFGSLCATCHVETTWDPTRVPAHDAFTLTGAHLTAACGACHAADRADPQPTACLGCHRDDRDRAEPAHDAFPDDCSACHGTTAWRPATGVDHDQFYPLTGAHRTVDCGRCHTNDVFAGTPRTCVGCHAADREGATPPHTRFPDTCDDCHDTIGWRPAELPDHDLFFPLRGAHTDVVCRGCHVDDVYPGTPRTCVGCHAADRDGATPTHAGFPDACTGCHTEDAWRPSSFAGHDQWYPIEGAHQQLDCARCHVDDVFAGTPRTCVGCHAADRDGATPTHAGFPDDCLVCHTQQAWRPADFTGHDQWFPLEGAHQQVECARCHVNGVYAGTPRACIGCHQTDFDTAVPTHVRYAPECLECHTQAAWRPAHYDHVFRVPHEGVRACGDCHTQPQDFGLLGCTTCHEHRRSEVDDEHDDVRNYQYLDAECVRYHPRGDED
ncbi:MAG: hypothetical protein H6704_03155 [Myxococcales bacterium]|nr:hypothetical protein [Myxococcales bacterium]